MRNAYKMQKTGTHTRVSIKGFCDTLGRQHTDYNDHCGKLFFWFRYFLVSFVFREGDPCILMNYVWIKFQMLKLTNFDEHFQLWIWLHKDWWFLMEIRWMLPFISSCSVVAWLVFFCDRLWKVWNLQQQLVFWVVATQIFVIFTPNLRDMIQFDEHIFEMGWNHQLVFQFFDPPPGCNRE